MNTYEVWIDRPVAVYLQDPVTVDGELCLNERGPYAATTPKLLHTLALTQADALAEATRNLLPGETVRSVTLQH